MHLNHNSANSKKGAILILLLCLIFVSALMVTTFVQTALNELRFSNQQLADAALRPHAESALQVVLASLNEYRAMNQPIHRISEALNQACQHPAFSFQNRSKSRLYRRLCCKNWTQYAAKSKSMDSLTRTTGNITI